MSHHLESCQVKIIYVDRGRYLIIHIKVEKKVSFLVKFKNTLNHYVTISNTTH